MIKRKLMIEEQKFLRTELQDLKKCQVGYFTWAVAGTGAILSFAYQSPGSSCPRCFIYLVPLVLIIPCCFTFFDKATTITRIVGYMRILEDILTDSPKAKNIGYVGYENGLADCRKHEKKIVIILRRQRKDESVDAKTKGNVDTRTRGARTRKSKRRWVSFGEALWFRTRHRYWVMNFYTFASLAIVCGVCAIVDAFFLSTDATWVAKSFCITVWVAGLLCLLYPFVTLWHLTVGDYSYDNFKFMWAMVMNKERLNKSRGLAIAENE